MKKIFFFQKNNLKKTNDYQKTYDAANCLIALMRSLDSHKCPFITRRTHLPMQRIVLLARYNKMSVALSHILTCTHCQSIVPKNDLQKLRQTYKKKYLIRSLLLQHETDAFQEIAKKMKLRFVFLKNKQAVPEIYSHRHAAIGTDVDILIHIHDLDRLTKYYKDLGYTIIDYPKKERNFINPKTRISIDVHTTIAFPHYGDVLEQDADAIQKINAICLKTKNTFPSIHSLLITSIIRFWSNDLARGLKQLIDILDISLQYEDSISWSTVVQQLKDLGYYSRYVLLLLLGKRLFGYTLPAYFKKEHFPFRILALASLLSVTDILYIDDFITWYTPKYNRLARYYYLQYLFITYISDTRYLATKVIRPRFIPVLLSLITQSIYTKKQHVI